MLRRTIFLLEMVAGTPGAFVAPAMCVIANVVQIHVLSLLVFGHDYITSLM